MSLRLAAALAFAFATAAPAAAQSGPLYFPCPDLVDVRAGADHGQPCASGTWTHIEYWDVERELVFLPPVPGVPGADWYTCDTVAETFNRQVRFCSGELYELLPPVCHNIPLY